MLDNAKIGHNNPPPFDQEVFGDHDKTVNDFMEASKQWLNMEELKNEADAEALTDQISGLGKLVKKVDEARKAAKKPHDDAGRAVQAAYTPLIEKLKRAQTSLKEKLSVWVTARAKAEEEERQKREEEAARAAKEAEAARAAAEANGDISAQVEAEQKAAQAEEEAKVASRPVETKVRSATGAGRTLSQRSVKMVEVTNVRLVFQRYQDRPEVLDLLTRLATSEVRAAGFDHEATPIPGVNVRIETKLA